MSGNPLSSIYGSGRAFQGLSVQPKVESHAPSTERAGLRQVNWRRRSGGSAALRSVPDVCAIDPRQVRSALTVVGERIIYELRGVALPRP